MGVRTGRQSQAALLRGRIPTALLAGDDRVLDGTCSFDDRNVGGRRGPLAGTADSARSTRGEIVA
jgi:hypothetical protein